MGEMMEYLLALAAAAILLFILLHLRTLTENEVRYLGIKRRNRHVEEYFRSDNTECKFTLKWSLDTRGAFYPVDFTLYSIASIVAGLLKYKKHEWIVIAFEKQKRVDRLWVNKGQNKSSASIYLPVNQVLETAIENGCSSVLVFHNHPNSNPNRYDCRHASETDRAIALHWSDTLNPRGINVGMYVCERGRPYRYFLSPSISLLDSCIMDIKRVNGVSWYDNLQLHWERIS